MDTKLDRDALIVLHGFLALPNRDKMKVVEAMNEYFDSTAKDEIRADYDAQFEMLRVTEGGLECKCCGRK